MTDFLTPEERAAMAEAGGYLSRNRQYLARLQRMRRSSMVRIDYMPGKDALAIFDARMAQARPGSAAATNSAVLDAILTEWAALTGIDCQVIERPMSPAAAGGVMRPARAFAYDFGASASDSERPACGHARANDSEAIPDCLLRIMARVKPTPPKRVTCGARRHRDGQPCQAKSEPGKRRCRFHGGRSTGPRTPEGRARALANLLKGKARPEAV